MVVEDVLRSASTQAHVAIVTLSRPGWVEKSARIYLPGLDLPLLLAELGICVYPCPSTVDATKKKELVLGKPSKPVLKRI